MSRPALAIDRSPAPVWRSLKLCTRQSQSAHILSAVRACQLLTSRRQTCRRRYSCLRCLGPWELASPGCQCWAPLTISTRKVAALDHDCAKNRISIVA